MIAAGLVGRRHRPRRRSFFAVTDAGRGGCRCDAGGDRPGFCKRAANARPGRGAATVLSPTALGRAAARTSRRAVSASASRARPPGRLAGPGGSARTFLPVVQARSPRPRSSCTDRLHVVRPSATGSAYSSSAFSALARTLFPDGGTSSFWSSPTRFVRIVREFPPMTLHTIDRIIPCPRAPEPHTPAQSPHTRPCCASSSVRAPGRMQSSNASIGRARFKPGHGGACRRFLGKNPGELTPASTSPDFRVRQGRRDPASDLMRLAPAGSPISSTTPSRPCPRRGRVRELGAEALEKKGLTSVRPSPLAGSVAPCHGQRCPITTALFLS